MKHLLTRMGTKVVNQNAKKEANSVCLCLAYQPKMPEAVKNLKRQKK